MYILVTIQSITLNYLILSCAGATHASEDRRHDRLLELTLLFLLSYYDNKPKSLIHLNYL
jgi:hypothetical protein